MSATHDAGRPASLIIEDSPQSLAARAAEEVLARAREAIAARGRFTWVLSGGSTPRALYSLLAQKHGNSIDWGQVHFFFSDERHVGPIHPDSNFKMAQEALFSPLALPAANVHRMAGEEPDAQAAAWAYAVELRRFFDVSANEFPRFDFSLLGMGADGHTASLFPGAAELLEKEKLVLAPWVEKLNAFRITLSAPALNASRGVAFLVSGEDKSEALKRALQAPPAGEAPLPCQLIQPREGPVLWMVDAAAARGLPEGLRSSPG
jgi:6-phosphogluconolactonase